MQSWYISTFSPSMVVNMRRQALDGIALIAT
jgi:hypothetical protein